MQVERQDKVMRITNGRMSLLSITEDLGGLSFSAHTSGRVYLNRETVEEMEDALGCYLEIGSFVDPEDDLTDEYPHSTQE
jgi:hypothetical protein